jgi:hypothetical protein
MTETEIEALAVQIAAPGFDPTHENLRAVVGHLCRDEFKAVNEGAEKIYKSSIEEMQTARDSAVGLGRLARASGCPDNVVIIPWLRDRGLAEEVEGGVWKFKTAALGTST